MNSQFKKGVVEMCVLSLVRQKDRYGYELIEAISKEVKISEGTIYPILRRLTQEEYFETYLMESESGPPRKYYKITKKGVKASDQLNDEWFDFIEKVKKLMRGEK